MKRYCDGGNAYLEILMDVHVFKPVDCEKEFLARILIYGRIRISGDLH
jgi:hypothetical protein